jgi:hypothetical protein
MERRERERILNQGAVRQHDPRDRAQGEAVREDLEGSPVVGRPLPFRLRNFRPGPDSYLTAIGGPLPYMRRLRQIEEESDAHERDLGRRWRDLAAACNGDREAFAHGWRQIAERWNFAAVNTLIEKHNHYYPAESRLPMDPRTGDFVLVAGRPFRRPFLDSVWVLERFPPVLERARTAA